VGTPKDFVTALLSGLRTPISHRCGAGFGAVPGVAVTQQPWCCDPEVLKNPLIVGAEPSLPCCYYTPYP